MGWKHLLIDIAERISQLKWQKSTYYVASTRYILDITIVYYCESSNSHKCLPRWALSQLRFLLSSHFKMASVSTFYFNIKFNPGFITVHCLGTWVFTWACYFMIHFLDRVLLQFSLLLIVVVIDEKICPVGHMVLGSWCHLENLQKVEPGWMEGTLGVGLESSEP